MKKKLFISAVVAVLLLILLNTSLYTVGEAEQVVIVEFGKVVGDAVIDPGLHFKLPWQDDRRFEKRWLEWDGEPSQITTLDKRYIYIDVFARWRIAQPLVFIEKLRDETSAQGRLDDILDNATRNVIANHNLIEAIRSTNREFEAWEDALGEAPAPSLPALPPAPAAADRDGADAGPADPEADADAGVADEAPSAALALVLAAPPLAGATSDDMYRIEAGREKLIGLILENAAPKAADLGIDLKDVQIKRINYIESVQAKVFERMVSERRKVAERFRSEGQGLSAMILGRMDRELKRIQSGAYRLSEEIRGRADAEAARIYAEAYRKDPEFYEFTKTMESYQQTIDENTWLLLTTDSDYTKRISSMGGSAR
ncbi:MAG TPA: protease modulator HflC [Polyangia bacterium]|nr:protease modulator HflC [Polyangia bacterium]